MTVFVILFKLDVCGGLPTGFAANTKVNTAVAHKSERDLSSETIDGSSLSLESVDNVEGGDGLTASVFGVGDSVTDDGFQEGLEDSTGFLVDQSGDSLDSPSASETTDGWLGDSSNVISQDLSVAFSSALSQSFSSFSSSRLGKKKK